MSVDLQVDFLSIEDVYEIGQQILGDLLVRDAGALASATVRPQMSVFGQDAYPTFATKAAALLHGVVRSHPLVDGNKRLGWSALRVFCLMNDSDLTYTIDDAEAMVLGAATGNLDVGAIASWISDSSTVPQ